MSVDMEFLTAEDVALEIANDVETHMQIEGSSYAAIDPIDGDAHSASFRLDTFDGGVWRVTVERVTEGQS